MALNLKRLALFHSYLEFLGKFYHGYFFQGWTFPRTLCNYPYTLCGYQFLMFIRWIQEYLDPLFQWFILHTWYWFLFCCLRRFHFFLKLANINSIFDFRITNSLQIFSLPFPMGVLCGNPIKVILKVTSPRLS